MIKKIVLFILLIFTEKISSINLEDKFIEVLHWKQIEYSHHPEENGDFAFPGSINREEKNLDYTAYNNVPMGVNHYNGRVFITMPRRRTGIPATLNYINLREVDDHSKSPKLTGYPSYGINELHSPPRSDPERIISVYRTRIDRCGRLWFVDTGMLEYPNNKTQIQQPSVWVIDLNTDTIIKRFELPENIVTDGRGLASITVDVEEKHCSEAFAYIPDLYNRNIYVYRFIDDRIWSFSHNYFSFDPLWGDFDIAGQKFQWDDGIFSITLSPKGHDGYRTAYFHPMVSISEFAVSTKVLQNEHNANRSYHGHDFQHLGFRGPFKQSNMHDYDLKTDVIFYTAIAKSGIGCWNTKKPFTEVNHFLLESDENRMMYPSDLTVDLDGTVWVMTNSMPLFIYSSLDPNTYNFRVWKQNGKAAILNTVCDSNYSLL